jgi:uncharacterized protein (DUF433 family)
MDWTGCEFVERVEGRCGGAPTVVGTRVFPDIIVDCLDEGMAGEDIWENYPSLTPEQIKGLITFVQAKRSAA